MTRREEDQAHLAAQIGRPLRADSTIVSRCHLKLPIVAEVPPVLRTGEPFPTRFWLSCPLAHKRIARLEAAGMVGALDKRAKEEEAFGRALTAAHEDYKKGRDALVAPDAQYKPRGGVGGGRAGVKCLHAHYAHHLTGADNPVGKLVAELVEPLLCPVPCVVSSEGQAAKNPAWKEPPLQQTVG